MNIVNISRETATPVSNLSAEVLCEAFTRRTAKIGVIGLGYVGLPLALTAIQAGFTVLGFDKDAPRVSKLNSGESNIKHITAKMMAEALATQRF